MMGAVKSSFVDSAEHIGKCVPIIIILNAGANFGLTLEHMAITDLASTNK